jgi:hypothetical protein
VWHGRAGGGGVVLKGLLHLMFCVKGKNACIYSNIAVFVLSVQDYEYAGPPNTVLRWPKRYLKPALLPCDLLSSVCCVPLRYVTLNVDWVVSESPLSMSYQIVT